MTTVREYLESGTKEGYRLARKMLKEKYKLTPLCCVELKTRKNSLGHISIWIKCSWLGRWYSEKSFKRKCLKCQDEMVAIIMKREK